MDKLDLFPFSDLDYSLLVRTINERQDINTYAIDLGEILLNINSKYNISLKPQDKLIVFAYPEDPKELNVKKQINSNEFNKENTDTENQDLKNEINIIEE